MAMKILGQHASVAGVDADLYTAPALTQTVISTISICNTTGANSGYTIAVRGAGAVLATKHYIVKAGSIPANSTDFITVGFTLAATDVLTVSAVASDVAFNAFGDES